jgi:hypothetical protein
MLEGPRAPHEKEFTHVLEFLNQTLRSHGTHSLSQVSNNSEQNWSIAEEYPTALNTSNLANIRIITENDHILSHAVLKPMIIKSPYINFKVGAIGSVVTEESSRNQGFSKKIIQNCLDSAKSQDCDIAVLWTDIPDFYRKLGFELAGSEISFTIHQEFTPPEHPYELRFLDSIKVSPDALLKLFNTHTVGSVRTSEEIRKFLKIPNTRLYTAWDPQNQLVAYAVEGKGADLSGYIHEWGGSTKGLLNLLSWIRIKKQTHFTIILPLHSLNLMGQLMKIKAQYNQGFLGMIKIVNEESFFIKIKKAAAARGVPNLILHKKESGYEFGLPKFTIQCKDEKELVSLLFGPNDILEKNYFPSEAARTLNQAFPLDFWIWGWDSI